MTGESTRSRYLLGAQCGDVYGYGLVIYSTAPAMPLVTDAANTAQPMETETAVALIEVCKNQITDTQR